jgi:hypothetical protein
MFKWIVAELPGITYLAHFMDYPVLFGPYRHSNPAGEWPVWIEWSFHSADPYIHFISRLGPMCAERLSVWADL